MAVPPQLDGRLEDGIEAPAGDAVDEETDEDALVEEAGARLDTRARQEEDGEEVVVEAEAQLGDYDSDYQPADHEAVDGEVFSETAFLPEEPGLS